MSLLVISLFTFTLVCIFLMLTVSQDNKQSENFVTYSTIPSNCVEDIYGNIKCYPAYYYSPLYTRWPRYRRYPYRHARGWRRRW
ncbi:hypothetical protein QKU48_gp1233 [Fadolivirus algeromassiliense]|jgi:hypothetical protein|uniref:Uncharacterized protein n=1 Tax=Fadolivirus FV1/VV64 TaxID=3070911 RepID=A0A7D3UV96_9VIRU|nr:hypothetical protein QKU48_gp1233 [Fadolivirus algeromassiliense]QKF94691.1 hypothetical protein Fadolivirus_1_1233 [Fadolivirus FV1/VV64]